MLPVWNVILDAYIPAAYIKNEYQKLDIYKRISAIETEDEYMDMQDELLAISNRSKKVIFSHETALYLHGISDRTPFEHTITAPSGCIPSAAIKSECKVYYIKPDLFELGKQL